ncbi:hypothetical protein [Streptomyces sp. NPDC090445]|uniref:hypothetical protein n=1 Tax=Streptomyces sp. NPDC090445 TaxID=3365963 RepID=UPI003827AE0A
MAAILDEAAERAAKGGIQVTTAQRHVNWEFAERVLDAVLPGSTAYNPDKMTGIPLEDWQPFDLEKRDADVIEDDFLSYCEDLEGPLIVVNSTSFYPDQGPYFVEASHLVDFVKAFDTRVRDYFMWADVIVVSPATGIVVIAQDHGCIVKVRGNAIMAKPRDAADQ